jgi:hypothetical protein
MTASESERPNAEGKAEDPGFERFPGALPNETPFSGITRDGIAYILRVRSREEGTMDGSIW